MTITAQTTPASAPRVTIGRWMHAQKRTLSMLAALAGIWLAFSWATDGSFLEPRNLSNLSRQMAVTGILAIGMTLIIIPGHIDLSVGSTVAFVGAVLTILTTNQNLDPTLAFVLALALSVVIGAGQGALVAYQRIPAFIVTLGGMMAFRGLTMWITNGATIPLGDNWIAALGNAYVPRWISLGLISLYGVSVIRSALRESAERKRLQLEPLRWGGVALKLVGLLLVLGGVEVTLASYQGVPLAMLVMLLLAGVIGLFAKRSPWGRHLYAIGGNIEAAKLSGIRVRTLVFAVYGLMGALVALGACVLTARVGSASPDAGQLLELDAVAACVIGGTSLSGGRGTVAGAILGALVMESLNNGMSMANMDSFWQYIIKGVVLVAAVWFDVISGGRQSQ